MIEYKDYSESDSFDLVCEVVNYVFQKTKEQLGVKFSRLVFTEEDFQKIISSGGRIFVAYDTDRDIIIGTLSVAITHKESKFSNKEQLAAKIRCVAVLPDYSGKGVASELVKMAFSFCEKRAIRVIYLRTPANNYPALWLYKKKGFYKYEYRWVNNDHFMIGLIYKDNISKLYVAIHYCKEFLFNNAVHLMKMVFHDITSGN